ncbi:MAG: 6-phosphogluconolactonase [Phycisphaerales bacterium]|jgi:6-phosphogluconolactonase|nr:6-phosphogluconolactonase [Phycisphaerales bacterium]
MNLQPEIKVFPDPAAIAEEAAQRIVRAADEAIALTGRFHIGLSGGSTPKLLYQLLAKDLYRSRIDWPLVEIFFADERCVPPDHAESNYRMARETLLAHVPIPGDNIYRMKGEIDPPDEAAKEYGRMLKEKFGGPTIEEGGGLDMILLGMGEDGHTASLFPHTPALNETKHRCVANYVEKSTTGKSWRLTLTAPFINRARDVLILVAGSSKSKTLAEVLEGPRDPQRLPIQLIEPRDGRLTWLIDALAAGMDEAPD